MEAFIKSVFVENFSRKLFSFLLALIVWFIVSNSISTTRVFQRVPVRIVNLPENKTVRGIMPDGFLDRKITVALTGSKSVLDKMGSNDLEVVVNASNKKNDWAVQISKKNLVCVNSDVDLMSAVSQISHSELIIRLCRYVTEKIPVTILPPTGIAPQGYQFLDVWPKKLFHTISGPEDDIRSLLDEGIDLQFDLSSITREELDVLRDDSANNSEVSFFVPDEWKKIRIPCLNNAAQNLQGAEAVDIRLDFLYEEKLPLDVVVPLWIFYPSRAIGENPFTLKPTESVIERNGAMFFSKPLFVADVSRLFLDVVRENLEIIVFQTSQGSFRWEPQFVAEEYLEEVYVNRAMARENDAKEGKTRPHCSQQREYHRQRFHEYMHRMRLFCDKVTPLSLSIEPQGGFLVIEEKSSG